jgi:uncharacterized protein (DUF4415 family)
VSKTSLKLKASDAPVAIDWAAVDASPLSATPDADSPALTRTRAAELRPLDEVLPAFSTGKTRITINLDNAVLQAYKARAGGRGYQTLINETLREAMRGVQLADLVRNVIREELHTS